MWSWQKQNKLKFSVQKYISAVIYRRVGAPPLSRRPVFYIAMEWERTAEVKTRPANWEGPIQCRQLWLFQIVLFIISHPFHGIFTLIWETNQRIYIYTKYSQVLAFKIPINKYVHFINDNKPSFLCMEYYKNYLYYIFICLLVASANLYEKLACHFTLNDFLHTKNYLILITNSYIQYKSS